MKKIILLSCLLLAGVVVWGQKTKPASVRIKEIEVIFGKMETKLGELMVLADKLKDNKDAISEMNETDMLMLQRLMEKKSQLETMISNTMKAAYEGAQAAVQALKAS